MNFPILNMPRRLLDMENWFTTTLDLFDPFDEFDVEICHNIDWLRKPVFKKKKKPNVPSKYRLDIDVRGYRPKSLNMEIKDDKLFVSGCDEVKKGEDEFSKKEFRKAFKLPSNLDESKMVSFITKKGHMIIEIPYKKAKEEPKIDEKPDGSGTISYVMDVKNLDLTKLSVTLKDFDVIINYEELLQLYEDKSTRISNIKEFKLPDNVDLTTLKCTCDGSNLKIEANLLAETEGVKKIQIHFTETTEPAGKDVGKTSGGQQEGKESEREREVKAPEKQPSAESEAKGAAETEVAPEGQKITQATTQQSEQSKEPETKYERKEETRSTEIRSEPQKGESTQLSEQEIRSGEEAGKKREGESGEVSTSTSQPQQGESTQLSEQEIKSVEETGQKREHELGEVKSGDVPKNVGESTEEQTIPPKTIEKPSVVD